MARVVLFCVNVVTKQAFSEEPSQTWTNVHKDQKNHQLEGLWKIQFCRNVVTKQTFSEEPSQSWTNAHEEHMNHWLEKLVEDPIL